MLTDAAIKALRPQGKAYKVADRDGMYVRVMPTGAISFRLDYRLNGRRETVYLGKYGRDGISLARAREMCLDARRAVSEGRSPAIEKQREKRRIKEAKSFGEFGEKWLMNAPMADSTRAMRRSIFERELLPVWRSRLLSEITPDDLRAHCGKIVERGAPATAIHVRDILKQIYGFAILHGEKITNPADDVGPASIATFTPKDRSLSPTEIRIMLKQLEHVATLPTIRLGMKLYLMTMVRKSELQDAVWDEVDFENAVWTIPKERMKRSKAHNVYLSSQAIDIMIALKTCAGNSRYLLPSRYDADAPMSRAIFNRVTYSVVEQAKKEGLPLAPCKHPASDALLNFSGLGQL
ncbi:tyrosine-type recombinase/integrase [Gluconacetobacter sacchari]|uniref:tyrosine-type recombinase/integrase n=1 Tax=Gluconacetobacter sacchari TaxID=92759 RepID=UPI0039B546E2